MLEWQTREFQAPGGGSSDRLCSRPSGSSRLRSAICKPARVMRAVLALRLARVKNVFAADKRIRGRGYDGDGSKNLRGAGVASTTNATVTSAAPSLAGRKREVKRCAGTRVRLGGDHDRAAGSCQTHSRSRRLASVTNALKICSILSAEIPTPAGGTHFLNSPGLPDDQSHGQGFPSPRNR